MRRLLAYLSVLVIVAAIWFAVTPRFAQWRWDHLVSFDRKIRTINENYERGMGVPRISYPGGCSLFPYSHDVLMIHSFDPLTLVVENSVTGDTIPTQEVSDKVFEFTATELPVKVTVTVVEVLDDGISIDVRVRPCD